MHTATSLPSPRLNALVGTDQPAAPPLSQTLGEADGAANDILDQLAALGARLGIEVSPIPPADYRNVPDIARGLRDKLHGVRAALAELLQVV